MWLNQSLQSSTVSRSVKHFGNLSRTSLSSLILSCSALSFLLCSCCSFPLCSTIHLLSGVYDWGEIWVLSQFAPTKHIPPSSHQYSTETGILHPRHSLIQPSIYLCPHLSAPPLLTLAHTLLGKLTKIYCDADIDNKQTKKPQLARKDSGMRCKEDDARR